MAGKTEGRTITVRAEIPVLGMRRGARATLTDSEYLQRVIENGWLTRVRKADGEDPEPLSDAAAAGSGDRAEDAATAAEAASAAAATT